MPYISSEQRDEIEPWLEQFGSFRFLPPGELNYIITRILLLTNPKSYADYNILVGVLECAKLELYRRAIAPYEDRKRDENGEVYQ